MDDALDRRLPPTLDDVMGWGKHAALTYRAAARLFPGYIQWAAQTVGGLRGQLCAEALALFLEVPE